MRDGVAFVHAADLHLDAPFLGISAEDARVGRALAEATYAAFRRIVDLCIERDVDFLVIAGDAYNSGERSLRAQLRFREQMLRLAEAGIDVFIAHGNHDPLSGWSAGLGLPETVRVFPAERVERFEVERDGELVAAVYGRSYGRAAETSDFAPGYVRDASDPIAIGVMHANVGGYAGYDPYAPCTLDELHGRKMDYWALGHIHKHDVLSADPPVVYAGSPQGLTPNEVGRHGCVVVHARAGAATFEHVETGSVAWDAAEIEVSGARDLDEVRELIVARLEEARAADAEGVVMRLKLRGRSDAHTALQRPGVLDDLLADVRHHGMSSSPWVWLDRLDDLTQSRIDIAAVRDGVDFSAELVSVADGLEASPAEAAASIEAIGAQLGKTFVDFDATELTADIVAQARDTALDLLSPLDGEAR